MRQRGALQERARDPGVVGERQRVVAREQLGAAAAHAAHAQRRALEDDERGGACGAPACAVTSSADASAWSMASSSRTTPPNARAALKMAADLLVLAVEALEHALGAQERAELFGEREGEALVVVAERVGGGAIEDEDAAHVAARPERIAQRRAQHGAGAAAVGLHGGAGLAVHEADRLLLLEGEAERAGGVAARRDRADREALRQRALDVEELLLEHELRAGAVEQVQGGGVGAQRARAEAQQAIAAVAHRQRLRDQALLGGVLVARLGAADEAEEAGVVVQAQQLAVDAGLLAGLHGLEGAEEQAAAERAEAEQQAARGRRRTWRRRRRRPTRARGRRRPAAARTPGACRGRRRPRRRRARTRARRRRPRARRGREGDDGGEGDPERAHGVGREGPLALGAGDGSGRPRATAHVTRHQRPRRRRRAR